MFSKLKPIKDNVLARIEKKEEKTQAGLYIPETSKEEPTTAIVIHPGQSVHIKEGDRIFFKKYMGTKLDEQYIVLKEDEIVGIL